MPEPLHGREEAEAPGFCGGLENEPEMQHEGFKLHLPVQRVLGQCQHLLYREQLEHEFGNRSEEEWWVAHSGRQQLQAGWIFDGENKKGQVQFHQSQYFLWILQVRQSSFKGQKKSLPIWAQEIANHKIIIWSWVEIGGLRMDNVACSLYWQLISCHWDQSSVSVPYLWLKSHSLKSATTFKCNSINKKMPNSWNNYKYLNGNNEANRQKKRKWPQVPFQ